MALDAFPPRQAVFAALGAEPARASRASACRCLAGLAERGPWPRRRAGGKAKLGLPPVT